MNIITYEDFSRVELRSGTVVKVEPFLALKNQLTKCGLILGLKLGPNKLPHKSQNIIHQRVLSAVLLSVRQPSRRAILLGLCRNFFSLDFQMQTVRYV